VQTFLPYADFADSAQSLDSPRLGKQRVETLQILRALTFPSYGWAHHPAKVMWEGYVPALVSYGLAMVDEWTSRGAADSTRPQIAEFAPAALTTPIAHLPLPSWLGDERLHRSHQSNLIRKFGKFYAPRFPGVPGDLDYYWPGADVLPPEAALVGSPLPIVRPRDDEQLADWVDGGGVTMGETSPRGNDGPKWRAQLDAFSSIPSGSPFAVLEGAGQRLLLGEFTGAVTSFADGSVVGIRRPARFEGELARASFPYPALLQDPRTLFTVVGPTA
jgi:hypothetical protein